MQLDLGPQAVLPGIVSISSLKVWVLRLYLGAANRCSLIFLMTADEWFLPNLGDFHSVFGPDWNFIPNSNRIFILSLAPNMSVP